MSRPAHAISSGITLETCALSDTLCFRARILAKKGIGEVEVFENRLWQKLRFSSIISKIVTNYEDVC